MSGIWPFGLDIFGKLRKNAEYCKLNMESTRQAKIARLLQKELSELFRRQTAAMGGVLVSVSGVRVSPDLSVARGYLSIFPSDKAQDILANINKSAKSIRYEPGKDVALSVAQDPGVVVFHR